MAYSALETYLNDHFAGATAGVNLAKMAAEEHKSDEHGPFFGEISSQISADYDKLQELMASLGVEQSATKGALAEIGSKMMAPKFTAGEDDDLNAFVTIETLSIGVEGKVCMWKALQTIEDGNPALEAADLDTLLARATDQRERLEAERQKMAPRALAHTVNA